MVVIRLMPESLVGKAISAIGGEPLDLPETVPLGALGERPGPARLAETGPKRSATNGKAPATSR
ncbi:hypothetical protein JCM33774_06730 [Actinophytocola sp. KF-1]